MKPQPSSLILPLLLLLALIWPTVALADAAAPPVLIIIVNHAPADLTMEAIERDQSLEMSRRCVAWESYFCCYSGLLDDMAPSVIRIHSGEQSYDIPLSLEPNKYNQIFTLDLSNRTLQPGKLPLRDALLVAMRLLLTLLIEGAVFWLFGFRTCRSWLVFLIVNLITQGFLNIVLSTGQIIDGYRWLSLFLLEFVIFIVEFVAIPLAIKERELARRFLVVISANATSFVLGLLLITCVPV